MYFARCSFTALASIALTALLQRGVSAGCATGQCNVEVSSYVDPLVDGFLHSATVFDSNCNQIGYAEGDVVSEHISVDSTLPWTVEVQIEAGGFAPSGTVKYADQTYDLPGGDCEDGNSGLGADRDCWIQFTCP